MPGFLTKLSSASDASRARGLSPFKLIKVTFSSWTVQTYEQKKCPFENKELRVFLSEKRSGAGADAARKELDTLPFAN